MTVAEVEAHHAVPRCLLRLWDQANGSSGDRGDVPEAWENYPDLYRRHQREDGERRCEAWLEFTREAERWRIPVEISRADLEELVERSAVVLDAAKHRLIHESDFVQRLRHARGEGLDHHRGGQELHVYPAARGVLMHLAVDYIHPTPHGGRCRIRIYLPDEPERDAPVVICTELPNNPGMSVTNAAERIAGEVIYAHRLPTPLVWIEHYEHGARGTEEDPHTFDLVLFEHYEVEDLGGYLGEARKRIGEPTWKALDRASVETMIGGPLR